MTQPLDDIRALFDQFAAPKDAAAQALLAANPERGRLAELAAWIARWRGAPSLNRPILSLYAAAHAGGDPTTARERLEAIASGAALVAKAAVSQGAGLDVYDLALQRPVADPVLKAAMSERECAATMAFGMEALAKQPDLLVLNGFGPGTEAAAAVLAGALAGAGDSPAAERALAEAGGDPLQLLRQLGGRETAALAGAILAARIQSVPVLLDGGPAVAAALALRAANPEAVAHCRVGRAPADFDLRPLGGRALALDLELDDPAASLAALAVIRLAGAALAPA